MVLCRTGICRILFLGKCRAFLLLFEPVIGGLVSGCPSKLVMLNPPSPSIHLSQSLMMHNQASTWSTSPVQQNKSNTLVMQATQNP